MKDKKSWIYGIAMVLVIGILITSYFYLFYSSWEFTEDRPIKILLINSYHEDFFWSVEQINGFEDFLKKEEIDYELRKFHLNTILDKDEESRIENSKKAKEIIESWNPDIVYATDDLAQKYVSQDYIDTNLPWIFSGVNLNERDYNFENAKNIVGLLERKPVSEALDFFKLLFYDKSKITVIGDSGITGIAIQEEARSAIQNYEGVEIVNWHERILGEEDFKQKVLLANNDSDAIFFLWGEVFKDKEGEALELSDVFEWYVENSNIPEFSFWESVTEQGALFGVEITAYTHGKEAGKLLKRILINGEKPESIESYVPKEEKKTINLARANQLELHLDSSILIKSEVYDKFPWDIEE